MYQQKQNDAIVRCSIKTIAQPYVTGYMSLQRPYWFHRAKGGTWRRPDGWRGTKYPFPIEVLRRLFCDWWDNAAVARMRRNFCRNLCQRTFRHWESLLAYTSMAYMCFEYADYGCDGPGD